MDELSQVQTQPVPGAEPPPTMSGLATVLGVFTRPRATFEALAVRPRILLPIVILLLAHALLMFPLIQSGVIGDDAVAKLEALGKPDEQIEAVRNMYEGPVKYAILLPGPIIGVAFFVLVFGGLLYFMGNLMLGARLTFRHYVSVAAVAGLVALVDTAVRTLLAVSKGTMLFGMGAGAFLGVESAPMRILDSLTNPLLLWATAIQALGVGVMAKKGFGFGVLAVLPGFLIAVILSGMAR